MAEVILDEVKEAGSDALDGFDSGQVMNYVAAWALSLLSNLKDAEEPDLDQVASDVLAEAGGFAGNEAAKQAEATKIWQVTSDHPRPSHADLDVKRPPDAHACLKFFPRPRGSHAPHLIQLLVPEAKSWQGLLGGSPGPGTRGVHPPLPEDSRTGLEP